MGTQRILRMKAYQLFQYLSPGVATDIVKSMQAEQRDACRAALAKLAEQKRLRPVFVQRKSRDDQALWITNQLRLKLSDEIAESLLQVWLVKCQKELITTFLDKAGIEHDGEGSIEDLPKSLDKKKVGQAIDACLATHPAEVVAVYLRVFQLQEGEGWPEIAAYLESDERLRLGQQPAEVAAVEPAKPEPAKPEPADEPAEAAEPVVKAATKKAPAKKAAKAPAKKAAAKKTAKKKAAD